MPNRILRDYTYSEKVNALSWQAECLFIRLMTKADDFGSFHANTSLIKAALFPLRLDKIREADITRWLDELHKAGLIAFYKSESKLYVVIRDFGQRLRNMKKRFPAPPENMTATCSDSPPEEETKPKHETEHETEPAPAREVVYPFNSEDFKKAWQLWSDYKKQQFNFIYKPIGLQGALKELSELSNGSESDAIKIIIQSIQKGWKGFFKLHQNGKQQATSLTIEQVAEQFWGNAQRQ